MVRLIDRLNMTIAVDWDVKPQTKQNIKTNRMKEIKNGYKQHKIFTKK